MNIRLIDEAEGWALYTNGAKWIALTLNRSTGQVSRDPTASERRHMSGWNMRIVGPLTTAGVSYVAHGHWVSERYARRQFRERVKEAREARVAVEWTAAG